MDNETQRELSDKDELLADLLGQGWTHRRTAETVGISTKTVQRRMGDPAFASVVSRRRRERFGQLSGQLLTAGDMALNVLMGALASPDDKVSLQAANLVLAHGHRYTRTVDEDDTQTRLDALERRLAEETAAREALLGGYGPGGPQ